MKLSICNIIINYFLLHSDRSELQLKKLNNLVRKIENKFNVSIIDNNQEGLIIIQNLCSDFLSVEKEYIFQHDILNYLDELQPIYEWVNFRQWDRSQQYYDFLRKN